jgi:peptide/nickel transport system substrate-binding protein
VSAAAVSALVAASTAAFGSGAAGTTVSVRTAIDWTTFDVHANQSTGNSTFDMPAYDRLVARAPDLKIVPYLARSWSVTTRQATFVLRRDAKCADGTPVTPNVVLQSFEHLIEVPKVLDQMRNLFGAGPYSVSADPKRWTFTFRTGTPYRYLLNGFAQGTSAIYCPAAIANPAALQNGMFGSGPYVLVSASHMNQIVYSKRPEWSWGPAGTTAKVLPDTLIYRYVANDTTAANLLLTGGLDVSAISGPDVDRLAANTSLTRKQAQDYGPVFLLFNQRPDRVTADPRVREALSTVVDRAAWNQAANSGYGKVTTSILMPGAECYDPATAGLVPKPSIDRARQILQADGYTLSDGKLVKDGKPLRLRLLAATIFNLGPEYLLNQLTQLGVDVDLLNSDTTVYTQNLTAGNFDLAVQFARTPSPDPGLRIAFITGPPPPAGSNYSAAAAGDVTVARWIRLATQTLGKESCAYWKQIQARYLDQHYLLPLAAATVQFFARKGVSFAGLADLTYDPAFFRVS